MQAFAVISEFLSFNSVGVQTSSSLINCFPEALLLCTESIGFTQCMWSQMRINLHILVLDVLCSALIKQLSSGVCPCLIFARIVVHVAWASIWTKDDSLTVVSSVREPHHCIQVYLGSATGYIFCQAPVLCFRITPTHYISVLLCISGHSRYSPKSPFSFKSWMPKTIESSWNIKTKTNKQECIIPPLDFQVCSKDLQWNTENLDKRKFFRKHPLEMCQNCES